MARGKGKHSAKRGQIKKNKHLADKDNRKRRLYSQPQYLEDEVIQTEPEAVITEAEEVAVESEVIEKMEEGMPASVEAPEDKEPEDKEPEELAAEPAEEPVTELTEDLAASEAPEPDEELPADEASVDEEPSADEETEAPEQADKEAPADEEPEAPVDDGEPEEPVADEEPEAPVDDGEPEEPVADGDPEEPVDDEEPKASEPADEAPESQSKSIWKGIRIAAFLILVAVLLCVAYVLTDKYILSPEKFQQETTINDVDVSGLSEEQAREKIRNTINGETLTIYQDGKVIGTIQDFEFDYDFGDKVEKCLHPEYPKKLTRLFNKEEREYTIKLEPVNQDKTFNKQFKQLEMVKNAKGSEETKDAYVDLSTHNFDVVSEVYGDSVDTSKLKEALRKSIGANEMEFDYEPETFRQEPKIKANSPEIQERLDYCHKYLGQTIRLNTFKGPYTIPPKEMDKFIKADDQGNRVIRKKKLKKFVKKLKENFSVYGGNYDLDLVGGHVQVSGGNYGVSVDKTKEYNQLKKDLEANTDVSRDLFYEGGKSPADGNDVGNSYVEIDISKQKLWCVVDGKTVVKSDVVTGNVAEGHATPTGVYEIAYKVSPCTLRGENADGSKYESKVTYWMPFNGGIGCHDATWRGSFGGSIYQYSGSHGCVNMPYGKAEELYYQVDSGFPVVVHD